MNFVQGETRDKVSTRLYKIPSSQLRSFYYNAVIWHKVLCITADKDRCCTEICRIHNHGTCPHSVIFHYNLHIILHGNYVCKILPVVAYHIKNNIRIVINNNKFY
jgi:hypothetical protein